jgi:Ion transport protein
VQQISFPRSLRRRVFLLLTEPETSIGSAVFFAVLVVTISLSNIVMMMQTMERWQFTPTDCRSCGGPVSYVFDDDGSIIDNPEGIQCVCPPSPLGWTVTILNWMVYFFTVEWTLRILTFQAPKHEEKSTIFGCVVQWFSFLMSTTTVLDALAIFPYYIENLTSSNGLMSLRLLRLFRVFQLVRLGQYNETFMSISSVLFKSIPYLKLLLSVMMFGAAFFGSMMYWLEKGEWKYYRATGSYHFIRLDQHGSEEISPFQSIPQAFWWFIVTSTTGARVCV